MKQAHIPDLDQLIDHAIADGRRHRAVGSLQHTATRHLEHLRRANTLAVMFSCVAATSLLFLACTPIPDGRDMCTSDRRAALEQANQTIQSL